jgi:hypothetical protein
MSIIRLKTGIDIERVNLTHIGYMDLEFCNEDFLPSSYEDDILNKTVEFVTWDDEQVQKKATELCADCNHMFLPLSLYGKAGW